MSLLYLDSSALVKPVVRKPESAALLDLLREYQKRASSAFALTEMPRALRRAGFGKLDGRRAQEVLGAVAMVDAESKAPAVETTGLFPVGMGCRNAQESRSYGGQPVDWPYSS